MSTPARRAAATLATLGTTIGTTLATACLPYTVASTAHTVAPHEVTQASIAYLIPNGIDVADQPQAIAMPGIDYEARYGIDDRTDVGIRVPSYSGAVVTYKRRLSGDADDRTAATAVMAGAGVVNMGSHAHAELSFLASGAESWSGGVTPYGGLRIMQVAPIERGATHDTPTAGGFLGLRIGDHLHGVSPEIGVYHDRSALGLRRRSIIVVPAISLYGHRALGLNGVFARGHGAGTGGAPPREGRPPAWPPVTHPVGRPVPQPSAQPLTPPFLPAASGVRDPRALRAPRAMPAEARRP